MDDRNFARRVFEPAIKAAGLDHLGATVYDLRHTFASWLLQGGVPIERVSQLLGHASWTTTQIYAHLAAPVSADVADAMIDPRGANGGQNVETSDYTTLRLVQ